MLLDEPTNHLDLRAKDVLLQALRAYNGTLVFVSHDRYFIDQLATRVFEIEGGHVHVYPGNYEDYLYRKAGGGSPPPAESVPASAKEPAAEAHAAEAAPFTGAAARPRRLNPMKVKQLEQQAAELEETAARLEQEIAEIELSLQTFVSAEETQRRMELLDARRRELEKAMADWESVSLELEQAG